MGRRERAQLFGVLGDPVEHSLSPRMQNAAFAAAGLPHLYLRYRVAPRGLARAFDEARRLGMGGLNLTVPLKEAALSLVDELSPAAARIGAVNTIVFRGRRLRGDNTDARGFLRSLAGRVRLRGATAVIVGAGGAARAVGTALVDGGVGRIVVANRTPSRAGALVRSLATMGTARVEAVRLAALAERGTLAGAALVVNTTPTGLHGRGPRIRYAAAPSRCLFVDLVYGARPTPFLVGAARAGRPTLDGSGMLLHQGALAFETWTGRPAPLAAMADALIAAGLPLTRRSGAGTSDHRRPGTMP